MEFTSEVEAQAGRRTKTAGDRVVLAWSSGWSAWRKKERLCTRQESPRGVAGKELGVVGIRRLDRADAGFGLEDRQCNARVGSLDDFRRGRKKSLRRNQRNQRNQSVSARVPPDDGSCRLVTETLHHVVLSPREPTYRPPIWLAGQPSEPSLESLNCSNRTQSRRSVSTTSFYLRPHLALVQLELLFAGSPWSPSPNAGGNPSEIHRK